MFWEVSSLSLVNCFFRISSARLKNACSMLTLVLALVSKKRIPCSLAIYDKKKCCSASATVAVHLIDILSPKSTFGKYFNTLKKKKSMPQKPYHFYFHCWIIVKVKSFLEVLNVQRKNDRPYCVIISMYLCSSAWLKKMDTGVHSHFFGAHLQKMF